MKTAKAVKTAKAATGTKGAKATKDSPTLKATAPVEAVEQQEEVPKRRIRCGKGLTEEQTLKNLKFWKKGQSGNPKGGSKKATDRNRINAFITEILKQGKIAPSVISGDSMSSGEIDAIERRLLAMSTDEVKVIVKAENSPLYMKALSVAMFADMKMGRTYTVDKLRERQYGTTKQQIELTGKDGQPLIKEPLIIEVIDSRDKVTPQEDETNSTTESTQGQ